MLDFNKPVQLRDSQNDLLTVGEMLVDLISEHYEEHAEHSAYHTFFGGSPANIAMNTKRLGIQPLVAAAVGDDRLGSFLCKQLEQANVDSRHIDRVDSATSIVVLNKSKGTPIPIFYRGADYELHWTKQLEEALIASKIVHISSWPLSQQPSRHTVEVLLQHARKHGILIGFDPNYHPMLWPKEMDGISYIKNLIAKVDIVKPSEDDAERLFGKDTPKNYIKQFIQLGAKLVILTMGENGAIASNGKELVEFPTLATEVVDTTGAGDAFWSGLYTAIVQGFTLRDALSLGFAVSAYKLKYTGAVVDLPKLGDLKHQYGL